MGDLLDREADELILVETMRQRKQVMEERADAFVTLPGGLGTLEEFFEIAVGRSLNTHAKPVILLNVAGFYDPLLEMVRHGIEAKFIRPRQWEHVQVAATVSDAIDLLDKHMIK
jgi:uncharacterized protein (TIGR00730 family)